MLVFVGLHKKEVRILFWDNFVRLCERVEKSPSVASEELGFNRSAVTAWKNGALPRVASRKKIADYFGISVDEQMQTIVDLLNGATQEERDAVETLLKSKVKKD